MMINWFLRILAIAAVTTVASAQIIPGNDAFLVNVEGKTFPNGYRTSDRLIKVDRPAPGTYIPGVVLVKTRRAYGVHSQARAIDGSSANITLASAGMSSVSSAFGLDQATPSFEQLRYEEVAGLDRIYRVEFTEPIEPFELCKKLMQSPDVEYAVPITVHKMSYTPNDPRYAQQPWLPLMQLPSAWDVTKGSADVLIAIVDSGTDWQHEDLASKIWTNPGETPNNNKDDDGNGYIDDIRGWDFVGNISRTQAQSGILLPDNDPRVVYPTINGTNGHGTVVAGCAAAATNNAIGIAAPAINCKILPIKCGSDNPSVGSILQGYTAIKYAADLGADVINCSWGGPGEDPSAQDMVDYANAKGAIVVAASGNDGQNLDLYSQNPANLSGVLTVGATNNNDRVTSFSNYGWGVHVYAPGENILSTFPNNSYQALSGTSFSSPLVAGIVALVRTLHPDWTPEQIREHIRSTSDAMSTVSAGNRPMYYGRANADRAVRFNNTWSGNNTVPGIILNAVNVTGGNIVSNNPTNVTIQLKNILGNAGGVVLSIRPRANGVTIAPSGDIQLGNISNNETKDAQLTFTLGPNFPWYAPEIELELTIKSGNYINYMIARVPVSLPTSNTWTSLFENVQFGYGPGTLVEYTSDGTFWSNTSFFSQPAMIRGTSSGAGGVLSLPFTPSCMSAFSGTNCMVGGVRNGVATVATSNDGTSFTSTGVNASLATVAGIHMYDANNAIAVGDPTSNRIGVARTTNGGSIWTAVGSAPLTSNANEKVIVGSACFLGDAIWFGTTDRRILYSTNRGQQWGSGKLNVNGAVISSLAFKDANNGVLLYRTSSASNAPFRIASTQNGGATWQSDVFDPASLGITPVSVLSSGNKHHVMVGTNGEVYGSDNNGKDWQPILSRPAGTVNGAVAIGGSSGVNGTGVIMVGFRSSLLQYRYSGPNGSRVLQVVSDTVEYGNVESGKNRLRSVQVNNVGESDVRVDSVVITMEGSTPDSAFRITNMLDDVITSEAMDQLGVRMYATDTGSYRATVKIYSNATPNMIQATLVGTVTPVVSVDEDGRTPSIVIAPNPTSDIVRIELQQPATISLVDLNGQQLGTWTSTETGSFSIDLSRYASGRYSLVIVYSEHVSHHTLTITR